MKYEVIGDVIVNSHGDVTIGDVIVNSRGDVMAHYSYGRWETKNDEVLEFIAKLEKPVKVEVIKEVKKAKPIFRKVSEE